MTIIRPINRILTTVVFSIYHLLALLLRLLNCVMSVLLLNAYWIGLDWIPKATDGV